MLRMAWSIDPPVHHCKTDCLTLDLTLATIALLPGQRGKFEFGIHCILSLISGNSSFGAARGELPAPGELHVYPNIQQISEYALLARTGRLGLDWRTQDASSWDRRITSSDCATIRRMITTSISTGAARLVRQKLTVKQFQADQSQRIIFHARLRSHDDQPIPGLEPGRLCAQLDVDAQLRRALSQGDSVGLDYASRIIFTTMCHLLAANAR